MNRTLRRKVVPGLALALSAAVVAGLAIAVKRATDFDFDLELSWDDLPA